LLDIGPDRLAREKATRKIMRSLIVDRVFKEVKTWLGEPPGKNLSHIVGMKRNPKQYWDA